MGVTCKCYVVFGWWVDEYRCKKWIKTQRAAADPQPKHAKVYATAEEEDEAEEEDDKDLDAMDLEDEMSKYLPGRMCIHPTNSHEGDDDIQWYLTFTFSDNSMENLQELLGDDARMDMGRQLAIEMGGCTSNPMLHAAMYIH